MRSPLSKFKTEELIAIAVTTVVSIPVITQPPAKSLNLSITDFFTAYLPKDRDRIGNEKLTIEKYLQ